jgi:NTE family protein
MKRALVLGGGGVLGVAWESGVAAGLLQAGVDLRNVDAIVGTSAGSLVGAQLAAGTMPGPHTATSRSKQSDTKPENAAIAGVSLLDPAKLDAQALSGVFSLWGKMQLTTLAEAAAIGAIARVVHRDAEAAWIAQICAGVGAGSRAWPACNFLVAAVDTESGQRRLFDRESGVDIGRVLAASCAVPGLFPSVEIEGRLYMDGQVCSSSHADVLLPHAPEEVLIAVPTNALTARGIGGHAERMLALEVEHLRNAGCRVHVLTPNQDDAMRIGPNLMDPRRALDVYEVGLAAGMAFAPAWA